MSVCVEMYNTQFTIYSVLLLLPKIKLQSNEFFFCFLFVCVIIILHVHKKRFRNLDLFIETLLGGDTEFKHYYY